MTTYAERRRLRALTLAGKLHRRYLGGLDKVTWAKLEQVAVSLLSDIVIFTVIEE